MKTLLSIALVLLSVVYIYGQENTILDLNGPSSVAYGATKWYWIDDSSIPPFSLFDVTGGGTIISTNISGSLREVQVQWTSSGSVKLIKGSTVYAQKNVSVSEPPIPPDPNTGISIDYNCGNTTVTRVSSPPSGVDWYWQDSGTGTSTQLSRGSNSWTIGSQQHIYLRAYKSSTGNWSTGSLDVGSVPVNPVPGQASGYGQSRCDVGSIDLSASPGNNANSIVWYDNSSGGDPLDTGLIFSTPILSSNTTYYAASYNTNTECESTTRIPITATIVELSNPGTLIGSREEFAIASDTLILEGTIVGEIVKWQYKTTGSWVDTLVTTNSFIYENISQPTYFRAIAQNGICDPVSSNEVFINILPMISMDLGDFEDLRPNQQTILTVDDGYSGYKWFKNNVVIPNETDNQLTVDRPGRYKVEVTSSGGADTTGIAVIRNQLKPNENAVVTYTYRIPSINEENPFAFKLNEQSISAQIYDGLGRAVQAVNMNGSPNELDVVGPIEYDDLGKKSTNYLPYVEDNLGSLYKANALNKQNYSASSHFDYYSNHPDYLENSAFAQTLFEPSPLNRPLEQGAPGAAWQLGQNTIKFQYDIADSAEVLFWKSKTLLTDIRHVYDVGQLYKNTTTDEDGNSTIEYTNKQGQTILKKSQVDGTTWAESYYIYDIYGQLMVVLPPEASSRLDTEFFGQSEQGRADFLNTWAFLYDYDGRNRMTMKKVPGADSVFMVYDQWDRLVLTQDGNQRQNNEWLFTKYDAMNRPIMTGIMNGGSESAERAVVAASDERYDTLDVIGTHQYSNYSYPTSGIDEFLTVTYYDNYEFDDHVLWDSLGLGFNDPENQLSQNNSVKGLVTGTITKAGNGSWIYSISYYDDEYRVIQTRSTNHLGGTDAVTNYHDFIGQVNRSVSTHSDGTTTATITRSYVYDHAGRLLQTWHMLNNETDSTLIAENHYNELGELIEKDLHGGTGGVFAQSLDYTYNIRGWLTSINDPSLSGSSDLFGMKLYYDSNPLDNSRIYFNGNIGGMVWSTPNDQKNSNIEERGYAYDYDGLSRLIRTDSYKDQNGWNSTSQYKTNYSYDLNGNIKTLLRRHLTYQSIDNLSYSYEGNRLNSVADSGDLPELGFIDGNTFGLDYSYDANGNMTKDRNKGIDSIYYNHLNLPIKVEFETAGDSITYLYDAAGIKLNQVVYKEGDTLKVTDYVGEFIYETDSTGERKLQLIQHEEGRIVPKYAIDGSTIEKYDYQYHLKDHLGNVRVTFSTEPENYTMVETFETGEENGWQDLHRHTSTDANTTPGGDEVELLQSGQTGAMIFLSVNKRDTINLSVQANYESAPSGNNFLGTAYNTLFTSFDNVYGSGVPEGGGVSSSSTVFDDALNGGAMAGKDDSNTAPRAFLNYILFDKDMNYVNAGFTQITTAAQGVGVHDSVTLDIPVFDQDGYVLAYLSNENQEAVNVHFDDFTVYHGKTNVVSTQDYYPFGLTFNESVRVASKEQRFLYNGKELQEETGWLDYGARMYQPEVGRFFNQDRYAEKYMNVNPYQYALNNPIYFIDVNGDSVNVAEQYRDQMTSVLSSVFGLKASEFSYSKAGNLIFNGDKDDFSKEEAAVFETFSTALNEETTTNIVFESTYSVTDNDGNEINVNTSDYGGEATATTTDLNISENYVIVDPAQNVRGTVYPINPSYDPSQPLSLSNPRYSSPQEINTSVENRTWHGIGHAILRGQTQDKVIDFDNLTRRANKRFNSLGSYLKPLPLRPYDETHNKDVQ